MSTDLLPSDIILESNLDTLAAAPLAMRLTTALNTPVQINAEKVVHVDKSCLQILIAAVRHWNRIGVPFEITNMTQAFLNAIKALGLDPIIFKSRVPLA